MRSPAGSAAWRDTPAARTGHRPIAHSGCRHSTAARTASIASGEAKSTLPTSRQACSVASSRSGWWGYAGSIALILHMAADPQEGAERPVELGTVEAVRRVVVDFLLPHAFEFYRTGESITDGDRLQRLASYVLTSGKERLTARDLMRN